MISDCAAEAATEFTVNDNGLLAVYAACPDHLTAIRNGVIFAAPAELTRGFIGLRQDKDTRGQL